MNAQIIRYLALNGPSLIYSVHKDLDSRSQTKVHYPTVNRRIHDLESQQYVEKVGKRDTKSGIPADLYATTLRGDLAALAGMPEASGNYISELSPKELRQVINTASARKGSPYLLFRYVLEEGQSGTDLIDKELVPEIINSIRNGYLNIDASNGEVICSAFASVVARKMTNLMATGGRHRSSGIIETPQHQVDMLMRSIEKIIGSHDFSRNKKVMSARKSDIPSNSANQLRLTPLSDQWANELKVFLKLHPAMFD